MPLGKYICDYCDKQFLDTPTARRRHLQGVQHQRAKAAWYNSLRDGNHQIPLESLGKGVCNRFVRTGSCQYGDSCKYFHPKPNSQSINSQGIPDNVPLQSLPENQLVGGSLPGGIVGDRMGIPLGNLPPSLKPPPEGGYEALPCIDWGWG